MIKKDNKVENESVKQVPPVAENESVKQASPVTGSRKYVVSEGRALTCKGHAMLRSGSEVKPCFFGNDKNRIAELVKAGFVELV